MGSGTPNKGQPVGLCLAALEGSTAGPASRVHYDVKGRARYRYLHELGSHACIPAMSTRSCKDTRHGHSDILRERLRRHKLHPEGKQGPLGGVQSQARRHPRSCGTVKRLRKGRARARGRDPSNLRMLRQSLIQSAILVQYPQADFAPARAFMNSDELSDR
jgi:hypothetical protein